MGSTDHSELDFFFDGTNVTVTVFGVNLTLTLSSPHPTNEEEAQKVTTQATIRTSHTHAKIFTMLLRKQLKMYEAGTKTSISLPSEVYTMLGLDEQDW